MEWRRSGNQTYIYADVDYRIECTNLVDDVGFRCHDGSRCAYDGYRRVGKCTSGEEMDGSKWCCSSGGFGRFRGAT
jgi:hypothetical protein